MDVEDPCLARASLSRGLMSATYSQVIVHFVWATRLRAPWIPHEVQPRLHGVISEQCASLGCIAMAVGGVSDHVHALVAVHPSVPVAHVARSMKAPSSAFLKRVLSRPEFAWQEGYGAFSVDPDDTNEARSYVIHQARHHAEQSVVPQWEITERAEPGEVSRRS